MALIFITSMEFVGHGEQVGAGVRSEADDLASDAFVLEGSDGGSEIFVARDDDSNVTAIGQSEQVDHQLDVEVGLDPPVAELPNVLGDHPVSVSPRKSRNFFGSHSWIEAE